MSGPSPGDAAPFPDRKQDLDHRGLNAYMEQHKVRDILWEMIAYLVEQRSEDHIQGALDFLEQYHRSETSSFPHSGTFSILRYSCACWSGCWEANPPDLLCVLSAILEVAAPTQNAWRI
jgi:hypothetical protein